MKIIFILTNWLWIGFFIFLLLPVQSYGQESGRVVVGAERTAAYLPLLEGKQVGLVVNHTSMVGDCHLADTLHSLGICIARLFAPEHGFRGALDAGANVLDDTDELTGAVITSLYGKHKKPQPEDLQGLDVIVFDMQDAGVRCYTYISTLYYVMEACAETGVRLIVLDRPNPNGHYVDGPVLDMRYSSFVGIAPLPLVHGCTIGELARLFKGENWIRHGYKLDLTVISCLNYDHRTKYELPVKPSPNLPNLHSILLYPSICLFEGTTCSVGRGTDYPFEMVGHPGFEPDSFSFIPCPNEGNKSPLYQGLECKGMDFRMVPFDRLFMDSCIHLDWLLKFYQEFPDKQAFFREDNFFDLLAGNGTLRRQIESGVPEAEIRKSWEQDLKAFLEIRKCYLLYKNE